MDTKFNGKIWTFGDDIDTDTIIPGKRGTIPTIEEMKRYAFELLKPEFGTAVKPGDILVAGKNFGCGSSREQAATVLSHNGVRCIIAKSFARIFFRNAFNNGIILLQCDGIQEVVKGGDIVTVDLENRRFRQMANPSLLAPFLRIFSKSSNTAVSWKIRRQRSKQATKRLNFLS